VELCRQYGLVATGGSDFHGPRVRSSQLGDPAIPLAVWDALSARIAEARAHRPPEPARKLYTPRVPPPRFASATGRKINNFGIGMPFASPLGGRARS
jgi:hypothetical protein